MKGLSKKQEDKMNHRTAFQPSTNYIDRNSKNRLFRVASKIAIFFKK
jgi:hypothetical protein